MTRTSKLAQRTSAGLTGGTVVLALALALVLILIMPAERRRTKHSTAELANSSEPGDTAAFNEAAAA